MGTLESPITRHPLEHRFLWGMAHNDETGHVVIRVSDDQNSLSLNTFATSNALVTIRSGGGQVSAGERIDYLPFE
jgi:molybdopterin biosynthesis enzyme